MLMRQGRNVTWDVDSWVTHQSQRHRAASPLGNARPLYSPPPLPPSLEMEIVDALVPVATPGGRWHLPNCYLPLLDQLVTQTAATCQLPQELARVEVEKALLRLRLGRVKKDWRLWLHKSSSRSERYQSARDLQLGVRQARSRSPCADQETSNVKPSGGKEDKTRCNRSVHSSRLTLHISSSEPTLNISARQQQLPVAAEPRREVARAVTPCLGGTHRVQQQDRNNSHNLCDGFQRDESDIRPPIILHSPTSEDSFHSIGNIYPEQQAYENTCKPSIEDSDNSIDTYWTAADITRDMLQEERQRGPTIHDITEY